MAHWDTREIADKDPIIENRYKSFNLNFFIIN